MRKQEKAVLIVALSDIISTAIKFVLGFLTGSLALLADAWHSLGDLVTSLVVFIALYLDSREIKKTDETGENDHKPAIRRAGWELRVSIVISIILSIVGLGILHKAIYGTTLRSVQNPVLAIITVCILMLISYLRFRFEVSVGKETDSPALVADAYHSRVDIYALSLVLISMLGESIGWGLDRWAAGVIGLLVLGIAARILYRSAKMILQQSRDTSPEIRSVEDNLVLVFLGSLSRGKHEAEGLINRHLHLDNIRIRSIFIRVTTWILISLAAIVYLSFGFTVVGLREVAILERFGNPVNISDPRGPGLMYYYPPPFGKVRKVDVQTIYRVPVGYVSQQRKELILWTNVHYIEENPILTGDNTFLDIAANMHYRIKNPADFLYTCTDPLKILERVVDESFRELVGVREFFPLMTHWRKQMEQDVRIRSQEKVDELKLGIEIVHIYLKDLHPPVEVAPSFEDVISAQEDLETFVEEARGYQKELLPSARGEATTRSEAARAERAHSILRATGKTSAFKSMHFAFRKNDEINRFRLRIEALESALTDTEKYVVDQKNTQYPVDLFLDYTQTTNPIISNFITDEEGESP